MSASNGEGHRTRRRAVRSEGPPAAHSTTATTEEAKPPASAAGSAGISGPAPGSGPSPSGAEPDPSTALAKQPDAVEAVPAAAAVAGTGTESAVAGAGTERGTAGAGTEDAAAGAGTEDAAAGTGTENAAAGAGAQNADAEESTTENEAAQTRKRGVARILAQAASALLVLALVCGAAVSVFAVRSARERDERRAEYLQTARQAIVNLTTIRADSAKQDIDRILALASGEFKTEFAGRVDPFTSIVQQAKVVSSGEIVEAALENDDDRSAHVLVAAKQTLTNAGQAEPQTRYYRFRVTVVRGDSGLTVSDVEFVA
ncbi:hypothetical protein [Nocardia sp. R6R-6]|uniref:hypothetical protein n=1 Tax=Nocardia sp. R6R-6 TaxID=3459303 RepID=UPI00403E319A